MRCPVCGTYTRVVDSRTPCAPGTMKQAMRDHGDTFKGAYVRLRKRKCRRGHTSTTVEIGVDAIRKIVIEPTD